VPIRESRAARFGTLFHRALEEWWLGYQRDVDQRLVMALASFGQVEETHGELDLEDVVIATELLRGYHLRWKDEPLETQLVEHEFSMPLVNPSTGRASRTFTLSGKIDAKVKDTRDGRTYLVEHKTTTSDIGEGSGYWQRLRMDGQVSTYYAAFPDVAGCIYDVIHRPQLRRYKATPEAERKFTKGTPCKVCKLRWRLPEELCSVCKGSGYEVEPKLYASQRAEDEPMEDFAARVREAIASAPDEYYKRGVVVRLDAEMREHQLDTWYQAQLIRDMANEGCHPRNPDACIQYGRTCDYFDVCTGVADIEDPRLFQIREAHPELRNQ
jgi:hypothetical protein